MEKFIAGNIDPLTRFPCRSMLRFQFLYVLCHGVERFTCQGSTLNKWFSRKPLLPRRGLPSLLGEWVWTFASSSMKLNVRVVLPSSPLLRSRASGQFSKPYISLYVNRTSDRDLANWTELTKVFFFFSLSSLSGLRMQLKGSVRDDRGGTCL